MVRFLGKEMASPTDEAEFIACSITNPAADVHRER
jgi:hypothetical protein